MDGFLFRNLAEFDQKCFYRAPFAIKLYLKRVQRAMRVKASLDQKERCGKYTQATQFHSFSTPPPPNYSPRPYTAARARASKD